MFKIWSIYLQFCRLRPVEMNVCGNQRYTSCMLLLFMWFNLSVGLMICSFCANYISSCVCPNTKWSTSFESWGQFDWIIMNTQENRQHNWTTLQRKEEKPSETECWPEITQTCFKCFLKIRFVGQALQSAHISPTPRISHPKKSS